MFEHLIEIDKSLMITLNAANSHTQLADTVFWLTSQTAVWIPLYLALLFLIIKQNGKESILITIFAILLILLCDQTASGILKPLVARLRPSHDPSIMDMLQYVNDYKGGKYGFPSSHASNTFGLATYITLLFRSKKIGIPMFVWAILNAYSRIYLGVHYPMDIIVGIAIGLVYGALLYKTYMIIREKEFCRKIKSDCKNSDKFIHLPGAIISLTFGVIICLGIKNEISSEGQYKTSTTKVAMNESTETIAKIRSIIFQYKVS